MTASGETRRSVRLRAYRFRSWGAARRGSSRILSLGRELLLCPALGIRDMAHPHQMIFYPLLHIRAWRSYGLGGRTRMLEEFSAGLRVSAPHVDGGALQLVAVINSGHKRPLPQPHMWMVVSASPTPHRASVARGRLMLRARVLRALPIAPVSRAGAWMACRACPRVREGFDARSSGNGGRHRGTVRLGRRTGASLELATLFWFSPKPVGRW